MATPYPLRSQPHPAETNTKVLQDYISELHWELAEVTAMGQRQAVPGAKRAARSAACTSS